MRRSSMRPTRGLHFGMVGAHHRKSIEGYVLDEGLERLLYGIESLEVIEMLGIDIGDDRDIGRQLQECAVRSSASTTIQSPAPSRALVP